MSMRGERESWLIEQYCTMAMRGLDDWIVEEHGDEADQRDEPPPLGTRNICDACQLGAHGHCRGPRWWRPQGCQCKNPDCEEWNREALRVEKRINDRNK